ncbi:hypothetical protein SCUCBS95973_009316 [Sporothrix curviconia]|uniref:Short chain type dehydrogenase n=1 Tax=Sporothrix curviconia TaxID=1260050 RepID=A0ABP0CTX5_9PEZI
MSAPVALILGAGARVGQSVARAFAAEGYRIALVARSAPKKDADGKQAYLHIKADLADPSSVAGIFDQVKKQLGVPQVVVYNAAAGIGDALTVSLADFAASLAINTTSVYAAAQEATAGFKTLSAGGAFIYTGNITNELPIPALGPVSIGKSATATLIQVFVGSPHKGAHSRYYYADERNADGSHVGGALDGDAHAALYTTLAKAPAQGPWQQTFVKGVGYKKF